MAVLGLAGRNAYDGFPVFHAEDAFRDLAEREDDTRRVSMAMVGDAMLMHVSNPFEHVQLVLRDADITFGNVENPLTRRGEPSPLKFSHGRLMYNEFIFGADKGADQALRNAGFNVVSLANNHAMDYGEPALMDTFRLLDRQGIAYTGAGRNIAEAREPAILDRNGIRFAFLAYVTADTLPGTEYFAADENTPGLAFLHSDDGRTLDPASRRMLKDDIQAARRRADVVVASMHWGREVHARPSTLQIQIAHRAVKYGADVVVGHHPHVLQAVEIYQGKPIFYSLGNFVFKAVRPELQPTGIAVLDIGADGVTNIIFRPAWIRNVRPALSKGRRARQTARRLVKLSRERGTQGFLAKQNGVDVAVFNLKPNDNETGSASAPPNAAAATAQRARQAPTDLVELTDVIPGITVDLRYATEDNAFGQAMYGEGRAFLRRAVAERLREAQRILASSGVRLKVWDAYRPLSVQRTMWKHTPDANYVAPPNRGSNHNRGAAVDVTLVDRNGEELPMGTGFDDFSPRAHQGYTRLTDQERQHRAILRHAMMKAGFRPLSTEWWHYSDPGASRYELSDLPFDALNSDV